VILAGHTVIYGGSFNPPHLGHQMSCLYLLEAMAAEAVWLVPAFRHPFGKELADFLPRVEMCERLAAPFAGRVLVSRIEALAGSSGRTYDTLTMLQAAHPARRLALAVGSDILPETPQWYRWPEIEAMVQVVVIARPGYPSARGTPVEMPAISSADLRRRLKTGQSIDGLVPTSVAEYIRHEGLFRG
jgi:nicotinate-nucleotide adenylyltransferase